MSSNIYKKTVICFCLIGSGVITTALVIAILPLSKYFEDFFVNGFNYDSKMSRSFIRFVDKETHFEILKQHHGGMGSMTLLGKPSGEW